MQHARPASPLASDPFSFPSGRPQVEQVSGWPGKLSRWSNPRRGLQYRHAFIRQHCEEANEVVRFDVSRNSSTGGRRCILRLPFLFLHSI